jgi:uncharacterized repeat protein (TIGR01451 family)
MGPEGEEGRMKVIHVLAGLGVLAAIWAAAVVPAWPQSGPSPTSSAANPGAGPALLPSSLPELFPDQAPRPEVTLDLAPASAESAPVEAGNRAERSAGRQEAAVSLEWLKPAHVRVGQPATFHLMVRNTRPIAVQEVIVRTQVPKGMKVQSTEPPANVENNVLWWDLGTLTANQEKRLQICLTADAGGEVNCHAWVTFTAAATMKLKVGEPRLVLKTTVPPKVLLGSPTTFLVTIRNTGNAAAEQVKVHAALSEGLDHPQGKSLNFPVGPLGPNESRTLSVSCGTTRGGEQTCDVVLDSEGNQQLRDHAALQVIEPRLNLEAAGPKLRYLNRKATYTVRVVNPTEAPVPNVQVRAAIPPGFRFDAADAGGRFDPATASVSWTLGEVEAFQTRTVKTELSAVAPGDFHLPFTTLAAHGIKADSEVFTRVEGLAALVLELADTEDPIEVGAETTYQVRISNTGSKTESDARLVCTIPEKMELKSASGPTRYQVRGKELVFEPLPPLAPRGEANFRITVKGIAPGDVRFKAQVTSASVTEPLIEMEPTRVYED